MAAEAVVHLERFTLEARNIRSAALSAHQDSLSLVCVISGVIQFLRKKKKKKNVPAAILQIRHLNQLKKIN